MITQLSRNPPFGICWQSTLWGAGEAVSGRSLTGGPPLQSYLKGVPGAAAGCAPEQASAAGACHQKAGCWRSGLQQEPSAGEAVYTGGAGRGTSHSYCSSLALDKPPALPGPGSREAPCVARARC